MKTRYKNYELLYSVKAHVPTHREGRKELGINGSSDLVDLGTFREDSQIDFVTGNVSCTSGGGGGGGVTQERFSNFSNNRFFSSREITGKTLSARKNIIGNITLSQTSCLSLNKFGLGHYIPDCRSAPFA